ncbi:SDR family NAD(P)-dependent oxidoreductase [Mycolicibacterium pulveris]|uniref:SDR family NAD(P)-dependent oxidoreductase n=1 Tax=Mycolicibacterium pulveris TaxID=36813 RepID=UPI003CEC328E
MTDLRFDEKVVVVTGAGRGIGRCHAVLLAARGARVVVADNGAEIDGRASSSRPADAVVAEILQSGGEAVACCASVADEDDASQGRQLAEQFAMSEEVMAEVNASMLPELCAPAAAFLAQSPVRSTARS